MHFPSGSEKPQILGFSDLQLVEAVPAAFVAAESAVESAAAAAAAGAVDAAEADAAYENESGAAETAVQLKECAWPDCWDKIVRQFHKTEGSSSQVHHLAQFAQSKLSDAGSPLSMHHLMLQEKQKDNNIIMRNDKHKKSPKVSTKDPLFINVGSSILKPIWTRRCYRILNTST